jgi:hypothetical protein
MRRKSLAATIRTDRVGKGGAPLPLITLSSCLDMVRRTLGQHDIPTLQTMVIDHAAGMVKLSTTLARLGEGESLRIGPALPSRRPGRLTFKFRLLSLPPIQ